VTSFILFTSPSIRLFARLPLAARSADGNDLINDKIMFVMEPRSGSVSQTNGTECRVSVTLLLEFTYHETVKYIYESRNIFEKNIADWSNVIF
jgi:hypothetical protein